MGARAMRECLDCGVVSPLEDRFFREIRPGNFRRTCRECVNKKVAQARAEGRELPFLPVGVLQPLVERFVEQYGRGGWSALAIRAGYLRNQNRDADVTTLKRRIGMARLGGTGRSTIRIESCRVETALRVLYALDLDPVDYGLLRRFLVRVLREP